jgi:hypothetical protein
LTALPGDGFATRCLVSMVDRSAGSIWQRANHGEIEGLDFNVSGRGGFGFRENTKIEKCGRTSQEAAIFDF